MSEKSGKKVVSWTAHAFMEAVDARELRVSDSSGFTPGLCAECGRSSWRMGDVWTARYRPNPEKHYCIAEKTPDISTVLFCFCECFGPIEKPTEKCDLFELRTKGFEVDS